MEKALKYSIWVGLVAVTLIPVFLNSSYYFPYIVPKTLIFKIVTEVLFLLFLGLAVIKKEYRPKLNLVLVLFFLYIIIVFASSLINDGFYFSFWSNNERSEGLLLLLHLFLYLFVLTGFLHKAKNWLVLFEASFISSILVSLFALGQYLNLGWILASAAGARLASTIGNPGYVAGYLIFNIFFGLILFFSRKNKYLRWYYILGILLQIFITMNTLTRGAILSLSFSLFIFIFYLAFFHLKENKMIRNTGIIILLLGIIFTGIVFANKDATWVKKNGTLRRVVSISFSDTTAENRLLTWKSSLRGFKEKPILGYGYESFYKVFDKYFEPQIYRKAGSVIWFDRAHNIVFDRLITGGIIGLSLYLSLLIVPLVYLWVYFRKKKREQYLIPVILSLVMLAYFIQNLFIFESLVTYIPLFLVLGYLSRYSPKWPGRFSQSKKIYLTLLVIGIIIYLPVLFTFNIKPASANRGLIKAMEMIYLKKYQEANTQFVSVLDRETHGNQEYRQHFAEFVDGALKEPGISGSWLNQSAIRVEQELEKQIEERPLSARNYLMFMRFLNNTRGQNPEHLVKALVLFERVAKISPTRPQIYTEAGYSQFYLGRYYQTIGETNKAEQLRQQAIVNMEKAIALNPEVIESYLNMIMILYLVDQSDQVQLYLDRMDELGLNWRTEDKLTRMANSAIHAEQYQWTLRIYQELLEISPQNPDYWVNLALSYAHLGQRQEAIKTAEKVKEFGGSYVEQAEAFINDVLAGKFGK